MGVGVRPLVNDSEILLASGQSSGSQTFTTGFTPTQVIVYNSSPATLYYTTGIATQLPQNAKRVPPNAYLAFAYTQSAQSFTLFWSSDTPLTQDYVVPVSWSNFSQPFNFAALTQDVSIPETVTVQQGAGSSFAVAPASGATFNVAGSVSIGSTVTVSPASGSTFTVSGTVNIGSTVTVSPASGSTFNVTGSVTISGTTTVSPLSGSTFNVGGSVSVSNTVTISPASGSTFNVTGSVTISNTVNIQQASGATLNVVFPSAQDVTIAAADVTLPANVENLLLNTNNLVFLGSQDMTVTNLANGSLVSDYLPGNTNTPIGLFDGEYIVWQSQGGYTYTYDTGNGTTFVNSGPSGAFSNAFANFYTTGVGVTVVGTPNSGVGGSGVGWWGPAFFTNPMALAGIQVQLTNASGSTIASDTVRVWIFGVKAQVTNPQGNPVQSQAASGAYGTTAYTNGGNYTNSNNVQEAPTTDNSITVPLAVTTTQTIISSGNFFSSLTTGQVNGSAQCSATLTLTLTNGTYDASGTYNPVRLSSSSASLFLQLFNGSQLLAQYGVSVPAFSNTGGTGSVSQQTTVTLSLGEFTFPLGTQNNGIVLQASLDSLEITFDNIGGNTSPTGIPEATASLEIFWNPMWEMQSSNTPPQTVSVVS